MADVLGLLGKEQRYTHPFKCMHLKTLQNVRDMDRTVEMDKESVKIWDVRNASLRSFACDSFSSLQRIISENTGIPPLQQLLLLQNMKLGNNNWRLYSSATWYLFSVNEPSRREIEDTPLTSAITCNPDGLGAYMDMQKELTNARFMQKHLVEGTGTLRCFADDESKIVKTKIQDTQRLFLECQKGVDGLLPLLEFAWKNWGLEDCGYLRELQEVQQKYSYFLKQCEQHDVELTKCRGHPKEDLNCKEAFNFFEKHRLEAEMNMARFERLMVLSGGKAAMVTKRAWKILVRTLEKLYNDLEDIYSRSSNANSFEIQKLNVIWKIRKNVDTYSEHHSQLTETVSKWQADLERLKGRWLNGFEDISK
ncbi:uncharacterized protein LOC124254715 [Haliotis rubra]|uniref:uncharacterized protein LOC124254715 n=1 Tax=Haliotis rubra TaxID=36100 RepID=UPI001EE5E4D0|nr:uncharacterized protein LOC124254715 [Haliotis rubra]